MIRLSVAALAAALVLTAPAHAAVTGSQISSPAGKTHVLYRSDALHPQTLAVAGTATGSGAVDIVCEAGPTVVHLLDGVAVAANGTFAAPDVPLDPLIDPNYEFSPGISCHLRAFPTGTSPATSGAFSGPELDVSKYSRQTISGTGGENDGKLTGYYLYAAGSRYATEVESFGGCGNFSTIQDPTTLERVSDALSCAGSAPFDSNRIDLAIDGGPAYAANGINGGIAGSGIQGTPGFPAVQEPVVRFDPAGGDVSVDEAVPFVKCGGDNAFPPYPWICTSFSPVPVHLQRTTSVLGDGQIFRTVDRWSSADGQPHQLDLSFVTGACLSESLGCSSRVEYRFPGEQAFDTHLAGQTVPAPEAFAPVVIQDGDDSPSGGAVLVPGQRADEVRFIEPRAFALRYRRTIPATGVLTLTHYYATVAPDKPAQSGYDVVKPLLPSVEPPVNPQPAQPSVVVPKPRLFQRGHVKLRRSGRTFVVVTRDRVQCAAACTVGVRGRQIVRTAFSVAAGKTAKVSFRLTRSGARKLRRTGRLQLKVTISAGEVTARRDLRLRARG